MSSQFIFWSDCRYAPHVHLNFFDVVEFHQEPVLLHSFHGEIREKMGIGGNDQPEGRTHT
jgi:hypothetical protein